MKVVDCFPFNNELNMLAFRFKELYSSVDNFILVEATRTFKGLPKPLYFNENKHLFSEYLDKVTHIIVDDMPEGDSTDAIWARDHFQRNAIHRGIIKLNLDRDDVIIISDCDEIVDVRILEEVRKLGFSGIARLKQDLYYYTINNYCDLNWDYAMILNIETYLNMGSKPHSIRYSYPSNTIQSGGWHFSFFGGASCIADKIKCYAHQEFNNEKYTNQEKIEYCIKEGKDILDRDYMHFTHIPVESNKYLPINYRMLM